MKEYPVVMVEWYDAHCEDNECYAVDELHPGALFHTVGYLLKQENGYFVLAAERDMVDDTWREVMYVPIPNTKVTLLQSVIEENITPLDRVS